MKSIIKLLVLSFILYFLNACEIIDQTELINTSHSYNYSINSSFDLPLYKYEKEIDSINLKVNNEEIDSSNTIIINNEVLLKSSFIISLYNKNEENKYNLILETNLGFHEITLNLNTKTTPYSYTNLRVKTNLNNDVIYKFELFDYEFVRITNNFINENDYEVNDNEIIIKKSFITKYFDDNNNEMVLSLLFENKNNETTLYFVVIEI